MTSTMHLALLTLCLISAGGRADEKTDPLEARKKAARENWDRVEAGPVAMETTDHFLIVAPKPMADKLKEHGELFEKQYDLVFKTIHQPKDKPFKGHLTVYLLPQADLLDTFIRRVEKRRPLAQQKGSFAADDEKLHVSAVPREKPDPPIEVQAGQQIASLMLQRKAGLSTNLPYWLVNGFGRATYFRNSPNQTAVRADRQAATRLINTKKRTAQDVWNAVLDGEESDILNPALADFFAYGPGRMKFL